LSENFYGVSKKLFGTYIQGFNQVTKFLVEYKYKLANHYTSHLWAGNVLISNGDNSLNLHS